MNSCFMAWANWRAFGSIDTAALLYALFFSLISWVVIQSVDFFIKKITKGRGDTESLQTKKPRNPRL